MKLILKNPIVLFIFFLGVVLVVCFPKAIKESVFLALLCLMGNATGAVQDCKYHLVSDYYFTSSNSSDEVIVLEKEKGILQEVVPTKVYFFDYNRSHIIAKREDLKKKRSSVANEQGEKPKIYDYWIIEVEKRKVHGPMSWEEFENKRRELSVSQRLHFDNFFRGWHLETWW
ncbi:MAG: DUF3997 domain-containing protein [Methylacidiphilales bacterium]|nr:DUF3997 domain-containing protein [Candidatus Methylacidiphilales bacterium]